MTALGHSVRPGDDFSVQGSGLALGAGNHILLLHLPGWEGNCPLSLWGAWPVASRVVISGPPANTTVWEWSLLESQVAELTPGHHQSSWKDTVVGEGWEGTVQGYMPIPQGSQSCFSPLPWSNGISKPQFAHL